MKQKTLALLAALGLAVLLAGCSSPSGTPVVPAPIEGTVELHTEVQAAYLASSYNSVASYADGKRELSFPKAVRLEWSPAAKNAKYRVEYGIWPDFRNATVCETTNPFLDVYNLLLGTDYYWRVTATANGHTMPASEVGVFHTSDVPPRNLFVDGITNVRDLGGWETAEGVTVRQGLLYRGGRLNKSWHPEVALDITEYGIQTMREILGIRSEIDLRKDYQAEESLLRSCVLGEDVNYFACPMEFDINTLGTNSIDGNRKMLRKVFSILAEEENYPVYFHCDIGTDRTGMVAFLTCGLLGVSEEDLYYEYLFSNFGRIGSSRSTSQIARSYVNTIKSKEGATLSEKIENTLLEIGVTEEEIEAIRTILL